MAMSIVAFVVLGSVLEGIPAIVLFGPLLFPIARQLGIHEVHYSMVVILAMGIGLFAPPFGVGYYAACAIGKVNPDEGVRADLALYGGAAGRPDRRRRNPQDLHGFPLKGRPGITQAGRRGPACQRRSRLLGSPEMSGHRTS